MAINISELADKIIMSNGTENLSSQAAQPCFTDSSLGIAGKRLFDFLLGSILIVLFSPLFIVLMLVVKLDSPGPAIFSHKRLGRHGQEFNCYKFRTMYENNTAILKQHFADSPANKETWVKFAKLRGNDPRVTRSGKWLRLWSLDELPQLMNVLKGEMSLVGPRPYLPNEKSKMGAGSGLILSVLPGVTGLWQVSGRNDINFDGRIQLESWYVVNRSLKIDILIFCRTIPVVLNRKGAY
ncbi:MAG: hypothetical protein CVU90_13725 [Firmicutes bacterium HGW-Firmicutes-15]|nr:MAG: hypothetical protein CVU90_13725 [Firmicutes bacterium HGW-Firmicutes-15]